MSRVLKKNAEFALRNAAHNNGNSGRSMTQDAIDLMALNSSHIIDLFAMYVEQTLPPKGGRGSRIQALHVSLAFGKMYKAMRDFMDSENNTGEEEE